VKLQNAESTAFLISLVCIERTVISKKLSDAFPFLDMKANALLLSTMNEESCFENYACAPDMSNLYCPGVGDFKCPGTTHLVTGL
jgi:hypothetical protein